nr:5-oxoprolinase subunit PxpB [Paenibacillus bovis]
MITYERIYPLSETAIVVDFGTTVDEETHKKVHALCTYLQNNKLNIIKEFVPAYTTVTIYYDCYMAFQQISSYNVTSGYEVMKAILKEFLTNMKETVDEKKKVIEIPVCYGGSFGPDLEIVAKHHHLTPEQVIHIHSKPKYLVHMIGFAPGFPYLGGLNEEIATPRRQSPRVKIPAGSVGIAGNQTGVYPIESPGGWQIIGRTPVKLFDPHKTPPTLLQTGNYITFKPISRKEYEQLAGVEW